MKLFFKYSNPLYGRVILVPFNKCLFKFPVSAVYDFFFRGHFDFFMPFSMSDFSGKNASFFGTCPLKICSLKIRNFFGLMSSFKTTTHELIRVIFFNGKMFQGCVPPEKDQTMILSLLYIATIFYR